jgi:mannose-6-phosphate isomerase-like protein (cupin superfamily)
MTTTLQELKVRKLTEAGRIEFGPLAFYHPLVADGDTPVRTGIQTSAPGYVAPMHWHPYIELLFIIEGEAEVWLQGGEAQPIHLDAGDCVALPADIPHSFRTVGDKPMRLLGIHSNPDRVVNYLDRGRSSTGPGPAPNPADPGDARNRRARGARYQACRTSFRDPRLWLR